MTVPLPTQYYKRVSDCSTAHTVLQESQRLFYCPHSATGQSVTVLQLTAHTVLQESQ